MGNDANNTANNSRPSNVQEQQSIRSNNRNRFTAVIFAVLFCFSAGLLGGWVGVRLATPESVLDRGVVNDGNAITSQEEEDIAGVAEKVGPSVVSIITTAQRYTFFGDQIEEGAGSGIILTNDGWILTNKHVVDDSGDLSVITSDGTVYEDVKVAGVDPLNDLAFLKVKGVTNFKPAELGDSSTVRIGQKVIAIGNSLGEFQNTVTSGIISGKGRPISAQKRGQVETLTDLLQTDAAINPGNSGGPLVNLSGQVIGVNTAIAEDAQSIGFSIPINSAKGIIKHLKKTGKVERAYLGINYIAITPEIAKKYKLPVKKGGYVYAENGPSVISGSPADKAGIKSKDIITKVGSIPVGDRGSVASLIGEYSTGETVRLTLLRDGNEKTIDVRLETYGS